MASAGRIKWTLFSSVCHKLKLSIHLFPPEAPRVEGVEVEGGVGCVCGGWEGALLFTRVENK